MQSETTKFTVHRIVLERFKQQVLDGRGMYTKTGVRVKYPRESWKAEREWGNLNFCGWVVWRNIWGSGGTKNARDRQSLMRILREAGTVCGL